MVLYLGLAGGFACTTDVAGLHPAAGRLGDVPTPPGNEQPGADHHEEWDSPSEGLAEDAAHCHAEGRPDRPRGALEGKHSAARPRRVEVRDEAGRGRVVETVGRSDDSPDEEEDPEAGGERRGNGEESPRAHHVGQQAGALEVVGQIAGGNDHHQPGHRRRSGESAGEGVTEPPLLLQQGQHPDQQARFDSIDEVYCDEGQCGQQPEWGSRADSPAVTNCCRRGTGHRGRVA